VIFLPIVAANCGWPPARGTYVGRLGAAFGALALGTFVFLDSRDFARTNSASPCSSAGVARLLLLRVHRRPAHADCLSEEAAKARSVFCF